MLLFSQFHGSGLLFKYRPCVGNEHRPGFQLEGAIRAGKIVLFEFLQLGIG